jgi:hypothetical protein
MHSTLTQPNSLWWLRGGRTADMLLLWSRFFWTRSLLNVNDQLLLSLVFVDRSSWKVNLVPSVVESSLP